MQKVWIAQQQRLDYRSGVIAATIANVFRRKGRKAHKPSEFMPDYKHRANGRKKPKEAKEVWADISRAMVMMGGYRADAAKH